LIVKLALLPLSATTACSTRHSSRVVSYSTAVNERPGVVAAAGRSKESCAGAVAGAEGHIARTSAAASGDHPSGRSPANDCEPTEVMVSVVPGGSVPAAVVSLALRVMLSSPPCCSEVPRAVRRMSMGTMPLPAGTTTCRQTSV
jgi:hypothetical protein